jgi:hypothetical protein
MPVNRRWYRDAERLDEARKRMVAAREARICMGRVKRDGIVTYHPIGADPHGRDCATCQAVEAEARAAHTHEARTYRDGVGVERFYCCMERVDGAQKA